MPDGDAAENERGGDGRVDSEGCGASGAVAGFDDKVAHGGIPLAIGIREMFDGHAEGVFEFFLAGEDFLAGVADRQAGQAGVGEGMGADGVAGAEPIAHFGVVHQRFWGFAVAQVPLVDVADAVGNQELESPQTMFGQRSEGVLPDVAKAIVESQRNAAVEGAVYMAGLGGSATDKPGGGQFGHLAHEGCGGDIEALQTHAARPWGDFVVHQDRHACAEELAEWPKGLVILRQWQSHRTSLH